MPSRSPRTTLRLIARAAACIAIGAAATLLGTWAMAVWGPVAIPKHPQTLTIQTTDPWPMPLPTSLRKEIEAIPNTTPGLVVIDDAWARWRGLRPAEKTVPESNWCSTMTHAVSLGYITSVGARDKVTVFMDAFQTGWPCRAMAHARVYGNGRRDFDDPLVEGLPVPKLLNRPERRLPLAPLWPGFAINTLAYAAAAWGLWQLPLAIRRRRRRKTNRCVTCGYDRAGLSGGAAVACPECGTLRSSA